MFKEGGGMTKSNNQLNKPMREDWEIEFNQMWYHSDTDFVAPRPQTVKDFIQQLLFQSKSQIVEQILGELEKEFLYYLTTNFVTDARKN